MGALTKDNPRKRRDEHDLRVAQHRREPGADELDRVVPEEEVRGEEDPGDPGPAALAHVAATPAPLLPPHQREERRQREEAAEECTGLGARMRETKEDPGERECDRSGEDRELWTAAEPRERHTYRCCSRHVLNIASPQSARVATNAMTSIP